MLLVLWCLSSLLRSGAADSGPVNQVVKYGDPFTLVYVPDALQSVSRVQWTLFRPYSVKDIYYANEDGGTVLSEHIGKLQFKNALSGYGVSVDSMEYPLAGRYQLTVVKPPLVEEKIISVATVRNFSCHPANHLISGSQHVHSCSAIVSDEDIIPKFSIYKNGQIMNGSLSYKRQTRWYNKGTSLYTYNSTFTTDPNVTSFTCLMEFRYNGSGSEISDKSDPLYHDSCTLDYSRKRIQYGAHNISIHPNSDSGPLILSVGQKLACSAEGYPYIRYRWDCGNDITIKHYALRYLEITDQFLKKEYTNCTCTVHNILSDSRIFRISKDVSFMAVHQGNIRVPPEDSILAFLNESVHLHCTVAPYVNSSTSINEFEYQWSVQFKNNKGIGKRLLYTASGDEYGVLDPWKDQFEAGESKHDLILKSGTFELGGDYKCDAVNIPQFYSFDVTVNFIGQAECVTPITTMRRGGTPLEMTCRIEYSGTNEPTILWFSDGQVAFLDYHDRDALQTTRKEITSVTERKFLMNRPGVTYKCQFNFNYFRRDRTTTECSTYIGFEE